MIDICCPGQREPFSLSNRGLTQAVSHMHTRLTEYALRPTFWVGRGIAEGEPNIIEGREWHSQTLNS